MSNKKPNVIYFFVDQQRWDTCGCYGQEMDVTPNLDQMASEGVKFENAYTCQPVCGPARACIQTGKWATEVGCWRNGIGLPQDVPNIATYMSTGGYEVAYIGKWHLASTHTEDVDINYRTKPVPMEYRGGYKDYWIASDVLEFTSHGYDGHMFDQDNNQKDFPEGRYRADAQTDWVLDYLDTRDGEKPFFLFISYIEPHHQNDRNCYEGPHGSKEKYKDFKVPGDLEDTEGNWRKEYPDYLGCCNSLDENLGRVRAKLAELGMDEDTLVIYTADHGSHFQTRNGEYKRCCHDGCTHIPMVAYGPGFKGGKVVDEVVSLLDTPATVLEAGGVDVPSDFGGRPLQEVVNGATDWPEEAFIQISESHVGRAIRTKKWTYSVRASDLDGWKVADSDVYTEDFLYDNDADPHQRNNLVADPAYCEIRKELAKRLKKRMVEANEKIPEIRPVG